MFLARFETKGRVAAVALPVVHQREPLKYSALEGEKKGNTKKKHMDTHMLLIFDFSRTDHVQRMRCRAKKLEGEGFESIEIWMKIYITCVPDSKFMKMEQREYFFHVALKSH